MFTPGLRSFTSDSPYVQLWAWLRRLRLSSLHDHPLWADESEGIATPKSTDCMPPALFTLHLHTCCLAISCYQAIFLKGVKWDFCPSIWVHRFFRQNPGLGIGQKTGKTVVDWKLRAAPSRPEWATLGCPSHWPRLVELPEKKNQFFKQTDNGWYSKVRGSLPTHVVTPKR